MIAFAQIIGAPLFKANAWEQSRHFSVRALRLIFYPVFLTHHILVNVVDFLLFFSVNIFDVSKTILIMKGSEH